MPNAIRNCGANRPWDFIPLQVDHEAIQIEAIKAIKSKEWCAALLIPPIAPKENRIGRAAQ